jgi:NADPH:quinone reductase-like Zn-dependent oxidoreductase
VIPIPDWMSFELAACIPEAWITAFQNVFLNARLENGQTVLLHGGGGGVNCAAIAVTRALAPDSKIIVTASPGKLERVRELGAHHVIDYRNEDFAARVRDLTGGSGADVILDHVGGPYLEANLKALAVDGRLALIGTLGGRKAEIDLARVLVKRQSIIGSVLRSRSIAEKSAIIAAFTARVMPHFSPEALPSIDRVLPLAQAAEAHRLMERSEHFGKIVLEVRGAR